MPGNNSATATTTVGPASADLSVTKTGTATVTPGGALTYTVTVTNNGPSDAAGVLLTDTPGAGIRGRHRTRLCRYPADLPGRHARGRVERVGHGDRARRIRR